MLLFLRQIIAGRIDSLIIRKYKVDICDRISYNVKNRVSFVNMSSSSWVARAVGMAGTSNQQGSEEEDLVVLVQGKNVFQDPIYCYIRIPTERLEEFRGKVSANEKFDIREYGDVIAAGRGQPSSEVQDEMARDYGMLPTEGIKKPEDSGA